MKRKNFFIACAMSLLVTTPLWQSCEKFALEDESETKNVADQVKITFKLFTPSTSRATAVADFKTVLVMDIVNDQVKQIIRQDVSSSQDFGSPTLNLLPGSHTLRFFATDASNAEMNGDLVSQQPLGDSFYKSIDINTDNINGTQRVILERQVAQVLYLGETPTDINGVLNSMDLKLGIPSENAQTSSLKKEEYLYTYIPSCGYLTLNDGTKIPVAKNRITRIDKNGSEGGGDLPNPPLEAEMLVATTDTALIYVAQQEITDVILAEIPNPESYFASQMGKYRIPTRREALILNKVTLPFDYWLGDRCLCYDDPADAGITIKSTTLGTGKHYTFMWGSGSVTSAGTKTAYSIKPIRSVPLAPLSQSFEIDGNFTWESDTTIVR